MSSPGENNEEESWMLRGGKRSWDDVDDRNRRRDPDERSLRRVRSQDPEEPCAKMARLPDSSHPSLSTLASSWPSLDDPPVVAAKSEFTEAEPTLEEAVKSNMTHELNKILPAETADTTNTTNHPHTLPYASRLTDYFAPGGPSRYLPRPEWIVHVGRKRQRCVRIADSSATSAGTRNERNADTRPPAAAVAARHARGGEYENNAPSNGLLPDHLFGAWAPAPRRGAAQNRNDTTSATAQAPQQGTASHEAASSNNHEPTSGSDAFALIWNDSTGTTPFLAASTKTTDVPLNPTCFGKDYDTALHVAIREGVTEAALGLLDKGASVHAENAKGVTPLVLASQRGNLNVAKELLERGATPMATSITGCTPLLQASHFGHGDVLNLLLQHGARLELANYKNTTALMRAAQEGHDHIVDILLRNGAMVNRRNNEQMSALLLASQRGHASVVKKLVDAKAEVNAMTSQDSTALMLACKRGHVNVVKVLVTSGCELQLRDARGRTARDMAQRKNSKELLRLLSPTMQIELMRRESRTQRNHVMIRMWWLLQQERAFVPVPDENNVIADPSFMTIHQLSDHPKSQRLMSRMGRGTRALVQAMMLPEPLLQHIATYIPLPHLWERRIGLITKRCGVDADSSVSCALDLIDEVLEEGGFVEACDKAGITPPPNFRDWRDWKSWRRQCDGVNQASLEESITDRPSATNSTLPSLRYCDSTASSSPASSPSRLIRCSNHTNPQQGPSSETAQSGPTCRGNDRPRKPSVQMRREVCFLQLLAYRSPLLTRTLASPPYNMPLVLIQQLKNINDIQSLVRRMGSRGVHFDGNVAIELVLLAGTVSSWYGREREE